MGEPSQPKKEKPVNFWYALVAFLAIGFGLGLVFEQIVAGLIVGWGVGILTVLMLRLKYQEKNKSD